MNLYIIAETMDPVSTSTRNIRDGAGERSAFAQQMLPTHTFATAPPLDVLLVPGGLGTRVVPAITPAVDFIRRTCGGGGGGGRRLAKEEEEEDSSEEEPQQQQQQKQPPPYLITICTGAGLAARAGVLDGKRATTNKNAWEETAVLGPRVEWVWRARWVRAEEGRVWTASGVSAGIDVTFAWIVEVYGEEVAAMLARVMEYRRVTDPEDDPFAELEDRLRN